jgi:glycosyltransferase involved in cell wall biosynthesis
MAMRGIKGVSSKVLSLAVSSDSVLPAGKDVILLPCLNRRWYLPAPKFITMYKMVKWADIVHLTNHWTALNAMIALISRMTGTPYLICPAGALPIFGQSSGLKRWYTRLVGSSLVAHAAAAIVITEDESLELSKYGLSKASIYQIPNGVRTKDFVYDDAKLFRDKIPLGCERYLLFVGRLNAIKGPDILLDAFTVVASKFPDLHLVFVGPDSGMLADLQASQAYGKLGQRIHFVGYANGDLKSSAYHGATLLVVPSRQEAMSIVALEAGICGTPVVMTDQCGFAEMVVAGAALEVSVDANDLAQSLVDVLQSPALLDEMGRRAKEFVGKSYTWDIAAKRYIEVCKEVIKH